VKEGEDENEVNTTINAPIVGGGISDNGGDDEKEQGRKGGWWLVSFIPLARLDGQQPDQHPQKNIARVHDQSAQITMCDPSNSTNLPSVHG
jgi:hypothetical protein